MDLKKTTNLEDLAIITKPALQLSTEMNEINGTKIP